MAIAIGCMVTGCGNDEVLNRIDDLQKQNTQLAEKLDVSEEQILEALEYRAPVSLDAKVGNDDGDGHLYDVIPDRNDSFEKFEDFESLRTEIAKLDPTEQKVVSLRFLHGKSQSEVGKILGVSQMFVSRAERKIVEKLRESLL